MTMLERLVESRVVASFAVGAAVWIAGRFGAPFPEDHAILQLIRVERPLVYDSIQWAYTILWFTTPYLLTSMAMSLAYVFLVKQRARPCGGPLPPYPVPAEREELYVVLGEVHHPKKPVPVSRPHWLSSPSGTGTRSGASEAWSWRSRATSATGCGRSSAGTGARPTTSR